jgi:hypothetical protein
MAEDAKGIFISYRREETSGQSGRLGDKLGEHFGEHRIFRDVESIDPGLDFVEAIERALESCAAMLVVIGRNWVTELKEHEQTGQEDYSRVEVATALERDDVRVIPVLVLGAAMPRADELPSDLAALSYRNAIELHENSWRYDVQRLTTKLEQVAGVTRQKEQPTGDQEASEVAARNIKETISNFLEFLQGRHIWREGEEFRYIAEPEKMRESADAIRVRLTDAINSLRRESYENLKLLTDIQDACLMLLKALGRNRRRLKEEPTFGETEFFDAVYPQLAKFQDVVVERCRHLCEDQNLCGETGPCRGLC